MGAKKAALSGQLSDIDLRHLRIFSAVVEAGGFTAAEITLNLANSTISNYIADLEKRLDMQLCERGRSGFKLTAHGELVYAASKQLFQSVDTFRQRVNQSHDRILGRLHLALAEHMLGINNNVIVQSLERFTNIAPDVQVTISTMGSDEVVEAVLNSQADLGVTVLSRQDIELDSTPLFEEKMQLYCAQKHPLFEQKQHSVEDIRQYNLVESARMRPGREPVASLQGWHSHAKAHHQESRMALVLSGNYLGYLPEHMVDQWRYQEKLKALLPEQLSYINTFHAIRKKPLVNQLIVETFLDCLT